MCNFSIKISKNEFESEGDLVAEGVLKIGGDIENFNASLSYWGRRQYCSQWREALNRLTIGFDRTAVVTTMYDPATANFIFWWLLYVIEEKIYIQNHVLFMGDLEDDFDEEDIYKFIPIRETHTEEGEPISEWSVTINDIEECLRKDCFITGQAN